MYVCKPPTCSCKLYWYFVEFSFVQVEVHTMRKNLQLQKSTLIYSFFIGHIYLYLGFKKKGSNYCGVPSIPIQSVVVQILYLARKISNVVFF